MLKGLETLGLRVEKMAQNAAAVADMLANHPKVERVYYAGHPSHAQYELAQRQMSGGSNMLAFDVKGKQADAYTLADNLALIKISNNLGDAKSIITHPATTTHQRLEEEDRLNWGFQRNYCVCQLAWKPKKICSAICNSHWIRFKICSKRENWAIIARLRLALFWPRIKSGAAIMHCVVHS